MFIENYSDFSLETPGCSPGAPLYRAHFKLDKDITSLFPYINAVGEDTLYYDNPNSIQFTLDGVRCAVYPDQVIAVPFKDRDQAKLFIKKFISFINDLYSKKDSIEPDHQKFRRIPAMDIFKLLPGTNCGECGLQTCMAFAAALSVGEKTPDKCPDLCNPSNEKAAKILSMLGKK